MGVRKWMALLATSLCLVVLPAKADSMWTTFKSRFLMPDGRVVDTGNGNVSHTEGQGYAMLMAVQNNDRQSFDKMWSWTNKTLKNKDSGLFYWRYVPTQANPISDKNNASDGDVLIAWALLRGGNQWHDSSLLNASDEIASAIIKHDVTTYAGYQVMLPGMKGFVKPDHIVLNPSYFLFPAWQAFADRSHLKVWSDLIRDGQSLLTKMRFGKANLATDWVAVASNGTMAPASNWPPRSSYDAIRVPLYVKWYKPTSALLTPWFNWWTCYSRAQTPAWVDVEKNQNSPYAMNEGLLAVRDYALDALMSPPALDIDDDYYSASLKMLVVMAQQDNAR
ncbi:endoglucanase [Enterobacteriaceae bacterium RIT691]|nr:endoglucanase [Enterobacteriaceae bacterium RIT691]